MLEFVLRILLILISFLIAMLYICGLASLLKPFFKKKKRVKKANASRNNTNNVKNHKNT